MNRQVKWGSWSLELPPTWCAEDDSVCLTLTSSDDIGALQLSSVRKECDVCDTDLFEFIEEEYGSGAAVEPSSCGGFEGFRLEHTDGATYWSDWWLRDGSTLLYVTYNCDNGKQDIEKEDVMKILGSLRPLVSATY